MKNSVNTDWLVNAIWVFHRIGTDVVGQRLLSHAQSQKLKNCILNVLEKLTKELFYESR